ncbi:hypothetical protein CPB83DRAFT_394877 [Crepidotus variabilis]|uniref:Uncharacterized protein n=1 Tax=Crepidotus variabilis TaxID=179855 RepID=A0A9P6EDG2_9AGAR|nr:hypothetical protein CPB83DRAFT_394877 [Crepidotus variabilis]
MSFSPPAQRLSNAGCSVSGDPSVRKHEEELINAYEAEEERIINVLSRKLEQLREDKIDLENTLEAESESHVNRLAKELGTLRVANQQLQQQLLQTQQQAESSSSSPQVPRTSNIPINGHSRTSSTNSAAFLESAGPSPSMSLSASPDTRLGYRAFMNGSKGVGSGEPNAEMMLEAMRRENEHLRNRLVDTERDYIRISRLNEIYREELIEHRRRVGLSVDNLIGLAADPFSQPTHQRSTSSSSSSSPAAHAFYSNTSSPSASVLHIPTAYAARHNHNSSMQVGHIPSTSHIPHRNYFPNAPGPSNSHTHSVPIPRHGAQVHRPRHLPLSSIEDEEILVGTMGSTPSSTSIDSHSPYPLSPESSSASFNPGSYVSTSTNITSPPSSLSMAMPTFAIPQRGLTYPSVPPPSLSSSFGSTVSSFRDPSLSPTEPRSRRNSNAGMRRGSIPNGRVAETGSLRSLNHGNNATLSRGASFDRGPLPVGGRVAEVGNLGVGRRSRAGSLQQGHGHVGQVPPTTIAELDDTDADSMELGAPPDVGVEDHDLSSTTTRGMLASVSSFVGLSSLKKDSEILPAKSR